MNDSFTPPWICLHMCYCSLIWWNAPNGTLWVSVLSCEGMLEAERLWKWSKQNAPLYFGCILHNGSLRQVRHTALVWQPAELCEPRALWARHWTTGLRSSGSLSVQHSTAVLGGQCSHWLTLCFAVSAASLDSLLFLLTSHICSFLQGQGCADFWWRTGSEKHPGSVLWTSPRLVDYSWFPSFSFSCSPPLSSQSVPGTVKYLTAVSPACFTFELIKNQRQLLD